MLFAASAPAPPLLQDTTAMVAAAATEAAISFLIMFRMSASLPNLSSQETSVNCVVSLVVRGS